MEASNSSQRLLTGVVKCDLYESKAQQLNNIAASSIENRSYDRAINFLQHALCLLKDDGRRRNNDHCCACDNGCTLIGCISYSEKHLPAANSIRIATYTKTNEENNKRKNNDYESSDPINNNSGRNKRRKIVTNEVVTSSCQINKKNANKINFFEKNANEKEMREDVGGGYIYRHPFRIPKVGHSMGCTLLVIVSFNLALSHQLKVMDEHDDEKPRMLMTSVNINTTKNFSKQSYKKKMIVRKTIDEKETITRKAFRLYKSALALQLKNQRQQRREGGNSIRFGMIVYNNLSELYRCINNQTKSTQCRKILLSSIKMNVKYKTRKNDSNNMCIRGNNDIDGFMKKICSNGDTLSSIRKGPCARAA